MVETSVPLRLLSLDGGGIRGLSSLYILQGIMRVLESKVGDDVARPLLPCDYFDLIAGTSTGGLIAIMLGTLRMDIDTCINEYIDMAQEIFPIENIISRNRLGILVNTMTGTQRFDPEPLEKAVKRLVKKHLGDRSPAGENTLLKFEASRGPLCKVFVCVNSEKMGKHFRFRSYESSWNDIDDCPIWQSCRATSAAPTLFPPMVIGKPPTAFVDGGLGYNNPIWPLIDEARHIWPNRDIGCLVSIGTGMLVSRDIGRAIMPLFDSLKAMATDSEKTADEFREDMKDKHGVDQKVYFRLNVQHGLEQVGLEEWKEADRIMVATRDYTRREWSQIDGCASQLYKPTGFLQEFEWYHQEGCKVYVAENYKQACRLLEQALAGRERLLGSDAQETAETRKYYAQSLFMAGQPKQAAEQFNSLVGFSERTYGSHHAETLSRRMSLGEALERCGGLDLPAASEQFRLAALGWESTVGPDTEKAIYCRYRAGLGYSKGEPYSCTWPYWKEAEENLQRAAEGWKSLRGAQDDKALEALIAYASVLLKKRDDFKALKVFKNALAVAKAKGHSKSHAQVREIRKGIDECQFWLGEGQPPERLEIARRRAAKANQSTHWREVTGHW